MWLITSGNSAKRQIYFKKISQLIETQYPAPLPATPKRGMDGCSLVCIITAQRASAQLAVFRLSLSVCLFSSLVSRILRISRALKRRRQPTPYWLCFHISVNNKLRVARPDCHFGLINYRTKNYPSIRLVTNTQSLKEISKDGTIIQLQVSQSRTIEKTR